MRNLLFGFFVAAFSAAASADETCQLADVPTILERVRSVEDRGELLGTYPTRDLCFTAWGNRLRGRESDDGKHLACVTRPTAAGGERTDLRALDFDAADALCLRINACLFDMYDRGENDPANRSLGQAWDRLSCMGH